MHLELTGADESSPPNSYREKRMGGPVQPNESKIKFDAALEYLHHVESRRGNESDAWYDQWREVALQLRSNLKQLGVIVWLLDECSGMRQHAAGIRKATALSNVGQLHPRLDVDWINYKRSACQDCLRAIDKAAGYMLLEAIGTIVRVDP